MKKKIDVQKALDALRYGKVVKIEGGCHLCGKQMDLTDLPLGAPGYCADCTDLKKQKWLEFMDEDPWKLDKKV